MKGIKKVMSGWRLTTPVTFIFFNRPDTTMQVISCIRAAKPKKLYLVSDGPRTSRSGEKEIVVQLRQTVERAIDWDCEVHRDYAEVNMGCHKRMRSGIFNTLAEEETTIIIEDDIIPLPCFFPYCEQLLERYRDDERIFYISGNNLLSGESVQDGSYVISRYPSIWGWATWRRAWEKYDDSMVFWEKVKKEGCVRRYYGERFGELFEKQLECAYSGERDTWDYQWEATRMYYGGFGITPKYNLIDNIGFNREDATHTQGGCMYDFTRRELPFPLVGPTHEDVDDRYDKLYIKKIVAREFERLYFWGKVRYRLRKLFRGNRSS